MTFDVHPIEDEDGRSVAHVAPMCSKTDIGSQDWHVHVHYKQSGWKHHPNYDTASSGAFHTASCEFDLVHPFSELIC